MGQRIRAAPLGRIVTGFHAIWKAMIQYLPRGRRQGSNAIFT
jgi:hypothetical protein